MHVIFMYAHKHIVNNKMNDGRRLGVMTCVQVSNSDQKHNPATVSAQWATIKVIMLTHACVMTQCSYTHDCVI